MKRIVCMLFMAVALAAISVPASAQINPGGVCIANTYTCGVYTTFQWTSIYAQSLPISGQASHTLVVPCTTATGSVCTIIRSTTAGEETWWYESSTLINFNARPVSGASGSIYLMVCNDITQACTPRTEALTYS